MSTLFIVFCFASGISFLVYGVSCLASAHMLNEYKRFGLARFRVLVGGLELLGGSAQLLAWWLPTLGTLSSGGLTVLMAMGVFTRIKIGDRLGQTLPAIAYLVLNASLFVAFLRL